MLGIITNLFKKENSKEDAKNRLKLVLIQDRAMLPSGVLENMKDDIKEGAAKVIILKHPDEAVAVKDKLALELGDEYEVAMSKPFFIEVNDKGISKGVSLDSLCKKLGLTNENVMALGDGLNDLSMIEFAGMGVAVDNANTTLKEAANFISKSNDEDGFAYAIEKFVLGKDV